MSQKPITSFFNVRKRPATDDIISSKSKILHIDRSSIDVEKARKELNLGDLKKKLINSPRFAELKEKAQRVSKGIKDLKEASAKKNLKEFSSIDVEIPSSPSSKINYAESLTPKKPVELPSEPRPLMSPRKVVVSPVKSPRKTPIYLKHAMLETSRLPLPYHYRLLAEMFRAMETVASLLYNRRQKITFSELKPGVQEMLKRNFTLDHVAQIKKLVPDFYNFEVEKCKNFSKSMKKDTHELVIVPNFPNEIKVMNPNVLLERRRYFFDILLQLMKKHHSQFLLTLDPPITINDDKLMRWHPEFDIEKVPEVECGKLPELPNTDKFSTAQDFLAKARDLFSCNARMKRAMEKLAETKGSSTPEGNTSDRLQDKGTSTKDNQPVPKPCTSGVTLLNPAFRNLSPAILEMVKAKQAAKALQAMTRSSEDEKLYLVYSRLPELAKLLRNIYVSEKKNVLALNVVVSKLDKGFDSWVSPVRLQEDVKLLSEKEPQFVKLQVIRNNTYLKLDKKAKIQEIVSRLESFADKYKS